MLQGNDIAEITRYVELKLNDAITKILIINIGFDLREITECIM